MRKFYAHTADAGDWQELGEHLTGVAELAERFAAAFDAADWGRVAGLWHDLGKYNPAFQAYLHGTGSRVEHAVAGALFAVERGERTRQDPYPLAFAIAGHHAGLANPQKDDGSRTRPLKQRLEAARALLASVLPHLPAAVAELAVPPLPARLVPAPGADALQLTRLRRQTELWIRFLFSALVDADFLDTERFYRGDRGALVNGFDDVAALARRLDAHVDQLAAAAPPTRVNALRAEVLAACRAAAEQPPGLFSLTVPTGGGKTLAAMSFALRHAVRHGLRRVIAVIPFTSIIEQNAAVYRRALGEHNVIEHHSSLDPAEETQRNKLASENWDAPVIVTTGVQFFESLFARRVSRCRKVHNVARSVVLLDEAQTLPVGFLRSVLAALAELRDGYGCSVVLATATQPALAQSADFPGGLHGVAEIAPDPARLSRSLSRFDVVWPSPEAAPTEWPDLAGELARHPRVLAVVHLRQDARDLAQLLPQEGLYHLSALMCAAHRSAVLAQVRAALAAQRCCRLVSTQLIEAGVDVDFPVVFRALGGLDSVIQAGGRCNREGGPERGRLVVFRAPTAPPPGTPQKGLEKTEALLRLAGGAVDLDDPEQITAYFRMLYQAENLDVQGIEAERGGLNFATVARRFRLIDDGYSEPVVVPYGEAAARLDRYRADPGRDTLRALQPYLVNVPRRTLEQLRRDGALEEVHQSVLAIATGYRHLYHDCYGLLLGDEAFADPAALIG